MLLTLLNRPLPLLWTIGMLGLSLESNSGELELARRPAISVAGEGRHPRLCTKLSPEYKRCEHYRGGCINILLGLSKNKEKLYMRYT